MPSLTDELPRPEQPHVIAVFGITGDLARRKILPGLFHLSVAGLLPTKYRIIGTARPNHAQSDDDFREYVRQAIVDFAADKAEGPEWDEFAANLRFATDPNDGDTGLPAVVARAESELDGDVRRLYHLAIPPDAMASVVERLGAAKLTERAKVIFEKPFGWDLASARALNQIIEEHLDESQVFRIDHFLGKESVDNILALRFANEFFEPLWSRNHVRYVQIDVPETLTMEGRGLFYDDTGAFRDMVVTHLFQVLGMLAMEQPTSLNAKPLRDEINKVFEAMRPLDPADVVRGQAIGYLDEPGVKPDSDTETFVALKAWIDNPRWIGVPFYLRTGKYMAESNQVITIGLREPVMRIFPEDTEHAGNQLIINFKDPGSIHAYFLAKQPGPSMRLGTARMHFHYKESFQVANRLEAYERLLLEVMLGNQALFTRSDGIERLWEVATPLLEHPPKVEYYRPGTWGPTMMNQVIAPERWLLPQ